MPSTIIPASQTDSTNWAQRLSRGGGYAASGMALMALLGLIGWSAGFPLLTSFGARIAVLPSESAMLMVGALSLAALHGAGIARARAVAWAAAAFIAAVAGSALLRRIGVATEPGFLRLGDPVSLQASVSSAGTYLLFAAALVAAAGEKVAAERLMRRLALASAGVCLVALVELALRALGGKLPPVGLAPPVALGLLAGSVSLLALRPAPQFLKLLRQDNRPALLWRYLLPPAIALPILVGWVQFLGYPSGWVTAESAGQFVTILTIVACTALILWAAERLDQIYGRPALGDVGLAGESEWLEATLRSIDDAVITANREGLVGLANPAAESLLGIAAGTAVGQPVAKLVQLDDELTGQAIGCPVDEALATQQPVIVAGEPVLRRADGSRRAVEASALPIRAASGCLAGGVLVLREVSARRTREHALREANVELDRRVEERAQALERATEALSESMALMETFASSTPELIIAKDRAGRITMINPAALRALGLTQEQAIGRSKMELFGESEETRHIYECDQQVLETGQPVTVEEHLATPRGPRTFLVTKSPLRDDHGRIFGLVGVATDITERNQAQQKLEQLLADEHRLRAEAEQANRAKDEFLAIVSHELRSPLNALKGWSHVLSSSGNPDPVLVHRAVRAIKRNVEQQTRLIDDLLDTSRIVSGKLTLERHPVDLVDVVRAALDQTQQTALAKKIDIRFDTEEPVLTVVGDPGRLQQVVINLLSNALKFTADEGQIEIGLRRNGEHIQLSVSDNGIGIDPDFLPHVFDRFSQADSSTTRRYWGLGIGLALVRHLVELHGGTVSAASPGAAQGSTFTVELPAAGGSLVGRPALAVRPAQLGQALAGIQVLLVDDDGDAREALQVLLEQSGAEVDSFDSGRALLRSLAAGPARESRVIVLDIAMPGEDGFTVLGQIRELENLLFIPVIAVTALTYIDRSHFERAGFQDCLSKPLDPERLVKAIANQVQVQGVIEPEAARPASEEGGK